MQVGHLTLHTRRDTAGAVRTRLERALDAAEPPTRRLVLVRRVAFGRLAVDGPSSSFERQVGETLEAVCAGAVHGSTSGAGSSNAVWFRSRAEASALFWELLLAGKRPRDWFWRLVMPRWNAENPRNWVAAELPRTWADRSARMVLARAICRAARAGYATQAVELFERADLSAITSGQESRGAIPQGTQAGERSPPASGEPAGEQASRLRPATELPYFSASRVVRNLIVAALTRTTRERAIGLATLAMVGERPDRATDLPGLSSTVRNLVDAVIATATESRRRGAHAASPPSDAARATPTGADLDQATAPEAREYPIGASGRGPADAGADAGEAPVRSDRAILSLEVEFAKAGLFLVLPLLNRLGLQQVIEDEGLSRRHNFAAHLLVKMALDFGQGDGSAMGQWLGLDPEECDRAARELAQPLAFWARLADKALRKYARRRLHDLAGRKGWIIRDDATLDVRYPLASADIALRRRALDVDPGWVPWLGRVVHFHFSDAAMDAVQ